MIIDRDVLRDFFASMALIGILGACNHYDGTDGKGNFDDAIRHTRTAYQYADEMLSARLEVPK